jgi:hypothetical protein
VAIREHPKEAERQARLQNARIWLRIGELQLTRGDDAAARGALDEAERSLGRLDASYWFDLRAVLAARLALREGAYKKAYDELSAVLWLDIPYEAGQSLADNARRRKFLEGLRLGGAAYLALAAAAHEVGQERVEVAARKEAALEGADLSALDAAAAGGDGTR